MSTKASKSTPTVQLTIANFTYDKGNGDKSNRQLLLLSRPDDCMFGVEIKDNDLTSVQPMINYLTELELLKEELRVKHGIKDIDLPYKRFKKDKITSIYESNITVK